MIMIFRKAVRCGIKCRLTFYNRRSDGAGRPAGLPLDIYVDINIPSPMAAIDLSLETLRIVHDSCVCFNLQRAARSQARRYDQALRQSGLTNGQFAVMMSLMGLRRPTIGSLAESLSMDRTTLTALLKPLQRRELVRSSAAAGDGRRRELSLTPEGVRVLRKALPLWQELHKQTETIKGAPPLSQFVASLQPFL